MLQRKIRLEIVITSNGILLTVKVAPVLAVSPAILLNLSVCQFGITLVMLLRRG